MAKSSAILQVRNLVCRFGGLVAVDDLSFEVEPETIHGLIGPNGAGKTTALKAICGAGTPASGQVTYAGRNITGIRVADLANMGLVGTFQDAIVFETLSVIDNVRVGCHRMAASSLAGRIFGSDRFVEKTATGRALDMLALVDLTKQRDMPAADLAHPQRRALGMAVALAAGPKVLLIDEPFNALGLDEIHAMSGLVRTIRNHGITIVLAEQAMGNVMGLCDTVTVLRAGATLAQGAPYQLRHQAVAGDAA